MHQQRLEPVVGVMRQRNVRGTGLTRRIEQRGMPELAGVIGQPPAPALRVHVTAHMRHSELARERLHVRSIEVRIRTEVVMHVNHDNTAMRGSPPHDRRARRNKHAGVHASRAPHRDRSSCCPAAAHDKLASHLSSQRMTSDA
jgi:hypothetical protein